MEKKKDLTISKEHLITKQENILESYDIDPRVIWFLYALITKTINRSLEKAALEL